MERRLNVKSVAILLSPLLLFAILVIPYGWLNGNVIVDWLGCGCPRVDELGNIYEPSFNANDFTALFWLFVSAVATVVSIFISGKTFLKEKRWVRAVYAVAVAVMSLFISYDLYLSMMWN